MSQPQSENLLVTVSGLPCSGTTSVAKNLAEQLGFEKISGGDIFRAQAEEQGYTLAEYTELAEENPEIDRELDNRLKGIAKEHSEGRREPNGNGLILESRLAGWMAKEYSDIAVWLSASPQVRHTRLDDREETLDEMKEREASEKRRYNDFYGIDLEDLSVYDLKVETAHLDSDTITRVVTNTIVNWDREQT